MQYIFQAVGHFDFGNDGQHAEWTPVASFTNLADAQAFCDRENDEVQAEMLVVEETTCVDDHGYPLTRREWSQLYPNRVFANMDMTFCDGRVFVEGVGLVYTSGMSA